MKIIKDFIYFSYKVLFIILIITPYFESNLHAKTSIKKHSYHPQNYYINSGSGSDLNSGKSKLQAWKSFTHLDTLKLKEGDSLLIKSNTIYYEQLQIKYAKGRNNYPVVISSYGEGEKPKIIGKIKDKNAVLLYNCTNTIIENLDISNYKIEAKEYDPNNYNNLKKKQNKINEKISGITVRLYNYGTSKNIILRNLLVHDVNGSLNKPTCGLGINIDIIGEQYSRYDNIIIEDCAIKNCSRNGIVVNNKFYTRQNWHPHYNVIIRRNFLTGVPGDGILTIGCDGALIEYNSIKDCPDSWNFTKKEAAAGIWPWSSDNTIIQFNEVSGHKATWDGQAFDSDYNCNNTTIRYNYSHDNYGGFLLICDEGDSHNSYSAGNNDVYIYGNISHNDGIRPYPTPRNNTWFSPIIHIAGPVYNTNINNNIIHCSKRENPLMDRSIIECTSWGGYPNKINISNNIFYSEDKPYDNVFSKGKEITYLNNSGEQYPGIHYFLKKIKINFGEITIVNKTTINNFFKKQNLDKSNNL